MTKPYFLLQRPPRTRPHAQQRVNHRLVRSLVRDLPNAGGFNNTTGMSTTYRVITPAVSADCLSVKSIRPSACTCPATRRKSGDAPIVRSRPVYFVSSLPYLLGYLPVFSDGMSLFSGLASGSKVRITSTQQRTFLSC